MPEYKFNIETPPVQAFPTTVTVTCGKSQLDMRQVQEGSNFAARYTVVGQWLPSPEIRQEIHTKDTGWVQPPSLPYDEMLALVKEQVQTLETRRLIREAFSTALYKENEDA